jgi:4-hydroxymandelate oxidase
VSVVNLHDFEALARERLDAKTWAYLSGGAGDEITLRENRAAWDRLRLVPRVLRDLASADTAVELLGRRWPTPLLLAPVAYQRLAHPDGEAASALAACAQGAGVVLSTLASVALEDVARLVLGERERGPLWFQLYLQPDRGFTRELLQRVRAAGYEALVLTVDAASAGARDRERRAGFQLPPGVAAVNLAGMARRPSAAGRSLLEQAQSHAPTWRDVEWLAAEAGLPLLLKGVLHADDARQAAALGLAGVIVSNHGGRTLDTTPATAHVLPQVADAVGGRLPLLVDGGIRRGTDVLKALALGARGVLIGRPQVWALAAGGAQGVAQMLRLLRDELEIAMALTGVAHPHEASRALIA